MNINYIYIKRTLIVFFCLSACYVLLNLTLAILGKPKNTEFSFRPITATSFNTVIEENMSQSSTLVGFNYKIIGYRAGAQRASVIVEKDNQTFVVQQGDLLENKYKLISVDSELAIFSQNGKSYKLSTSLQLNN
tara:strand:+ start:828 stop:1229 length:402 start_codon:yes stop_codon:yes gene_type:complete